MRTLVFALFLTFLVPAAHAGADKCLAAYKDVLLNQRGSLGEGAYKTLGLTAAEVNRLDFDSQDFSRTFKESDRMNSELTYGYEFHTGLFKVRQEIRLSTLPKDSKDDYQVEIDTSIEKPDGLPIYASGVKSILDQNCQVHVNSWYETRFTPDTKDANNVLAIKKTDADKGSPAAITIPVSVLRHSHALSQNDISGILKDPEMMTSQPIRVIDAEVNEYAFTFSQATPTRAYNTFSNRIENFDKGLKVSGTFDGKPVGIFTLYGADNGFHFWQFEKTDGEVETTQYLSKEAYLKAKMPSTFDRVPGQRWIYHFDALDFSSDKLVYHVTATDLFPMVDDVQTYFQIRNIVKKNGYVDFDVVANRWNLHPTPIPWVDRPDANDPNLQPTLLLTLDAVKPIADELRPQLVGMNRYQVARKVMEKVHEIIPYDQVMADSNDVPAESVNIILQKKTGVCQHIAAVAVAILRSLNIPARVTDGLYMWEDGYAGHSWVEFKIDDGTWWPLDPTRREETLHIEHYLPLLHDTPYSVSNMTDVYRLTNLDLAPILRIEKVSSSGFTIKKSLRNYFDHLSP